MPLLTELGNVFLGFGFYKYVTPNGVSEPCLKRRLGFRNRLFVSHNGLQKDWAGKCRARRASGASLQRAWQKDWACKWCQL
jgi:hypothetical protein